MLHSRQIRAAIVAAATALLVLAAPATAAIAAAEATTKTVTVVPGNTLSGIAHVQCGKASAWPSLYAANPQIHNPNLIYPGQRITIACAATTPTAHTGPVAAAGWVHPIRAGLAAISCWGAPRIGHTHKGVDLPARSGTPIRAAHAGRVVLIRYEAGGAGWYVALTHSDGVFTVYMHMVRRSPLTVGAQVQTGQVIGYVGATGNAQGPHLHFEVHRGALWHPVNPAPFMRQHGAPVGC